MADTYEARQRLRSTVLAAIEPFKGMREQPPFSAVEAITMAMVMEDDSDDGDDFNWCDGDTVNGFGIVRRVEKMFPCYLPSRNSPIWDAFKSYELPTHIDDDAGNTLETWYDIDLHTAQTYLQRALGLQLDKFSGFIRLPPELRNKIYEMVLAYPSHGVLPASAIFEETQSSFNVLTKDFRLPFSINEWTAQYSVLEDFDNFHTGSYQHRLSEFCGMKNHVLKFQTCRSKLAILLVNKQIYEEAMPLFYRINTLFFISVSHLEAKLRIMPQNRRQHLRKIGLSYVPADIPVVANSFNMLGSILQLHEVHIDVNEAS